MSILERNLSALLTRSWKPERPREAFRRQLLQELLEQIDRNRAPRPRMLRVVPLSLAAAAAVLLVFTALWLHTGGPLAPAPGLDGLLARGDVALRTEAAGSWRSASPSERAGYDFDGTYLEVVTPLGGEFALAAAGSADLRLGAQARLTASGGEAFLAAGSLSVSDPSGSTGWKLVTSEGTLQCGACRIDLAYVDGRDVDASLLARPDAQVVKAVLHEGSARVAGGSPIAPGTTAWLQAGHTLVAAAEPGVPARRRAVVVESPPEPTAEARPEPPQDVAFHGSVTRADGSAVERFRVWYRPEVSLPKVSEPTPLDFESRDGAFVVRGLRPGRYLVLIEAEGLAAARFDAQDYDGEHAIELAARLEIGAAVEGHVVDAATGGPIAGALVLVERDLPMQVLPVQGVQGDTLPHAHALTDSAGAFRIPNVSLARHQLRVSHAEYAPTWSSTFRTTSETATMLEPLGLRPGGRVAGRVEMSDGTPWPGAPVITAMVAMEGPGACMTFGYGVTDASGAYAIEHLPPGYYVAMNLGEQPNEAPEWSRVLQTTVKEGETSEVDFLGRATRTRVFGTLRDPAGVGLGRRALMLQSLPYDGPEHWVATETREDGSFEFKNVEPDHYALFLNSRAFDDMTLLMRLTVPETPELELEVELVDTRIDLTLREGDDPAATGWALIVEHASGSGWEFAGKYVRHPGNTDPLRWVPPGRYRVSQFPLADGYGCTVAGPIEVEAGEAANVELRVRPGGVGNVRVVDTHGRPVPEARMRLFDPDGVEIAFTLDPLTDQDGRIQTPGLTSGLWRIQAEHEDYSTVRQDFLVETGKSTEVTLVLTARAAADQPR